MIRFTVASPMPVPGNFRVDTLEKQKDFRLVRRIDAHAVVPHEKDGYTGRVPYTNFNAGFLLAAHELDRVVEQVGHHLQQPVTISCHRRADYLQ